MGLTTRCQQLIMAAHKTNDDPSAENVFLALLEEKSSVAFKVLEECCGKLFKTLQLIKPILARIKTKDTLSKILDIAAKESTILSSGFIGTEHILLGVLQSQSTIGSILQLIITVEQIREAIVKQKNLPHDIENFDKIKNLIDNFPADGDKTKAINQISSILSGKIV